MEHEGGLALEALRNTGKARQLRADFSGKKWAANIPATEYYGRLVSRDLRESSICLALASATSGTSHSFRIPVSCRWASTDWTKACAITLQRAGG